MATAPMLGGALPTTTAFEETAAPASVPSVGVTLQTTVSPRAQ